MKATIGLAVLLAWAAGPGATAQERGAAKDAAAPPPAAAGQAAPARGGEAKAEQDKPERAATPPGRGHPANRDAVVGEMKDAEVRHRERLAMIERLRALATAKGQTERLAALDKLESKENQRYERHLEKQRGKLGDDEYGKVKERLAKGREKVRGPNKDKGQPADRPNAPNAGDKKPDRPAAEKPKEGKPKDTGQDKPKGDDKSKDQDKGKEPKAGKSDDRGQGQGKDKGGKPKSGSRS